MSTSWDYHLRSIPLRPVVDRWSIAPWSDHVLPTAVVAVHGLVLWKTERGHWLTSLTMGERLTVYGTGATVVAIFGGLTAVAIAIYLAATGARAKLVRRTQAGALRRNWRALLTGAGLSAAGCVLAQGLEASKDPGAACLVFEFAALLAVTRFVRMVWLFDAVVHVADRDLAEQPLAPAPELSAAWKEPSTPSHLWPCGRVGCPDHPEGVRP